MKVALLTSDSFRHKYIAHCLAQQLELSLIITEKKSPAITTTDFLREEDAGFIKNHFLKRQNSEEEYFGEFNNFPSKPELLSIRHGEINFKEIISKIEESGINHILLFGTSIIKAELLNKYPDRIINLHLGLSPYYRGSATNLLPYYYDEPECVGGTIHLVTTQVDKGAILFQFRPDINRKDSLHDIGNKVILKGGRILPEILKKYNSGKLRPQVQSGTGQLCKNKDLSPNIVREIYKKFEGGIIEDYLADKEKRDTKKPIVNLAFGKH